MYPAIFQNQYAVIIYISQGLTRNKPDGRDTVTGPEIGGASDNDVALVVYLDDIIIHDVKFPVSARKEDALLYVRAVTISIVV